MAAPAQLYIWDDRFLWASHSFRGAMTRRYATNLIVAIGRTPLSLQLPGQEPQACRAAVCAAGAERCVDATDTPFLSFNLDPDAPGARLLERLADRGVVPVPRERLAELDGAMSRFLAGALEPDAARELGDGLVFALTGERPQVSPLDPRVRAVAEYLKANLPRDVGTEPLAQRAGLSSTRLVHLFTEQVGMPMTSFLLWAKMRRAISLIQSGQTLTRIAQNCGFADSSHLTRTFQSFYAVRPSVLVDARHVQVKLC